MLRGDQIRLDRAKQMKLVDEVVPQDKLVETAKAWIKDGGKAVQPWDQDGFKLPGGPVYSKAGMMVWPPANAIYRRETYDNYPGARAILKSTYEGLLLPIDQGLRIESRYFANVLRTKEAAAMIRYAVRVDAGTEQGRAPPGQCCRRRSSRRSPSWARASWARASPT